MQHRPSPDHRLVAGIEQPHRNHLQPLRLHGNDVLVCGGLGLLRRAPHNRHVRAVHVGVEQSDLVSELRQSQREIHRNGGLADAAFAAGDGDEVFYPRNGLAFRLLHGRWAWWHLLPLWWDSHSWLSSLQSIAIDSRSRLPQKRDKNVCPTHAPWHFLYFFPEPQGQGSLRPTFAPARTTRWIGWRSPAPAIRACSSSRRLRRWKASSRSSTEVATKRGGRWPFPSVPPREPMAGTPAGPPWS